MTMCMQEHLSLSSLAGMCCVVDGTIPASSGLSSSSALVCCAGLVTMEANQKSLSKVVLNVNPLTCITYCTTAAYHRCARFDFISGDSRRDVCEVWALYWHWGGRDGSVHFFPGRGGNSKPRVFHICSNNIRGIWDHM